MAWFNRRPKTAEVEKRSSVDTWLSDYLIPANEYGYGSFQYGNTSYPYGYGIQTTYGQTRAQEWSPTLPGYYAAVRRCPPAFAAQMVRAQVMSQARFTFRRRYTTPFGPKGSIFSTRDLDTLHVPWTNGTSGELISRMEWDAGLAGNAYVTNWSAGRLRVLRPDWVMLVYGSQREPDYPAQALDSKLLGYVYQNGGINSGIDKPEIISPVDMAHWSPIPDPLNAGIGMSWITPAIREIQADTLIAEHKIRYFENGATPNLVVKGIQAGSLPEFEEIVDKLEDRHAGIRNAYKTLYLTAGADATPVGANLGEIDFAAVTGSGEVRITMLSRVHPVILALSEGLHGSSLNAGNFGMARRIWADTWIYPTLQDLCAALAPLVNVPSSADLWFDPSDMPILREDASDAANILNVEATTVATLVKEGFTPDSAVATVKARDVTLLKHTGLMSVQLQPPGQGQPSVNGGGGAVPAAGPLTLSGDGSKANARAVEANGHAPELDEEADLMRAIGEALHPGATAKLMAYWSKGEGAAKIGWSTPGDFDRCRAELGKYVQKPGELAGLCANLHHMALGVWPGQEHGHKGRSVESPLDSEDRVGPHGYIHGWIKAGPGVGVPGSGAPGGGVPGGHGALTDAQFQAHTSDVESKVGAALDAGKATDKTEAINADAGVWKADRAERQRQVINEIYDAQAATARSDGKAIIAGGLGGAGKSTVLKQHLGVNPKDYVTINPDDVKEVMAAKGMVPDVPGLSPMERSALIHEESSHIANVIASRAMADHKNIIYDITMASPGSVQKRLDKLAAAGYGNVHGMFVDIPVETSVNRAMSRYRRGMESYRNGTGIGGRYVPPSIIRANADPTGRYQSANRGTFETLKPQFGSYSLYDNSGSAPKRLARTGTP